MNSRAPVILVALVLLVGCRSMETTQRESQPSSARTPAPPSVGQGDGETPEDRDWESTATPAITVVTSALEDVTPVPESDDQAREAERLTVQATGTAGPTPAPSASYEAAEVEAWAPLQVSPWPVSLQGTVLCLIQRESKGDASAVGGAGEVGLLQIHPVHAGWLATLGYSWGSLFDPATNIAAAWELFKKAGGLSPWGGGC